MKKKPKLNYYLIFDLHPHNGIRSYLFSDKSVQKALRRYIKWKFSGVDILKDKDIRIVELYFTYSTPSLNGGQKVFNSFIINLAQDTAYRQDDISIENMGCVLGCPKLYKCNFKDSKSPVNLLVFKLKDN